MSTDFLRALTYRAALAGLAFAIPGALSAQGARPDAPRHTAVPAVDAAASLTPETYHACYVPNTGTVYRIKTADTPTGCAKTTHVEFNWNNVGPTGPTGATGPQGPAGPAGTLTLPFAGTTSVNQTALAITQTGASRAATFTATTAEGVLGSSGGDAGVVGMATTPAAVGVRAYTPFETGTALEVVKGAIRVKGAGQNTPTTMFWTRFRDMGPQHEGECIITCWVVTIDHPLANGDPNAMLTVTPRYDGSGVFAGAVPDYYALRYNDTTARWQLIAHMTDYPAALYKTGFNILIVKP
jgi:hypothetical protein